MTKAYSENVLRLEEVEDRMAKVELSRTMCEFRNLVDHDGDVELSETLLPEKSPIESNEKTQVVVIILGDAMYSMSELHSKKMASISLLGDQEFDLQQLEEWQDSSCELAIITVSLIGDTTILIPENVELVRHMITLVGDVEMNILKKRKRIMELDDSPLAIYCWTSSKKVRVILKGFKLFGDLKIEYVK